MLYNKRAVTQCSYGCCREHTDHGRLRRREERKWRSEQW